MRFVVLDCETGGKIAGKHPVIQVAALAVSRMEAIDSFERKLRFKVEDCEAEALEVNSYDPEAWAAEAVDPADAVRDLGKFLRNHASVEFVSKDGKPYVVAQIVAHNAEFDQRHMTALFIAHDAFRPWAPQWLCTRQLVAWSALQTSTLGDIYALYDRGKVTRSMKLEALCEHYGIEPGGHDALRDARACLGIAKLFSRDQSEMVRLSAVS